MFWVALHCHVVRGDYSGGRPYQRRAVDQVHPDAHSESKLKKGGGGVTCGHLQGAGRSVPTALNRPRLPFDRCVTASANDRFLGLIGRTLSTALDGGLGCA